MVFQAPVNDDNACCAFMGLRPDTSKAHMVRALLEAMAFRVYQIWNVLCHEIDFPIIGAIRCLLPHLLLYFPPLGLFI